MGENKEKRVELSIIVPCYNEEEVVELFYNEVKKNIDDMNESYEIIFVNDGSKDNTLNIVKEISQKDTSVRYINFSRNFGKESAIYAGLQHSVGKFIVLMDADLQDPPAFIPVMYSKIQEEGVDCVAAYRSTRKNEKKLLSFFSTKFYDVFNKIADVDLVNGARDYRMMTREVVDAILSMKEYDRFSKGIFNWVGFNVEYIEYTNVTRQAGETSWNFKKLFEYALTGIFSFTVKPLRFSIHMGLLFLVFSLIYGGYAVSEYIVFGNIRGWTTVIMILLIGFSFTLISLGIISEYIARLYIEQKNRPIYIARDENE